MREKCRLKLKEFATSLVAGFLISMGCAANLHMSGGVVGALLFAFALLTIVTLQLDLLTGTFGSRPLYWDGFFVIYFGNIFGCLLGGLIFSYSLPGLKEAAEELILQRENLGILKAFLLSIPCGMIVTIAIAGVEDSYLPLLIGVPLFVLCGFPHCIADAGYALIAGRMYSFWPITIFGNYLGCNFYWLYRWYFSEKEPERKSIGFGSK